MITATFVKNIEGWTGDARLYRLSEPVKFGWEDDDKGEKFYTQYVIISATIAMFCGPETFIFPADPDGKVKEWSEMLGSYKGGLDHIRAIHNAGWVLGG